MLPELLASGDQPDVASIHFSVVAPFACKGWMLPIDDYIGALPPPDWPDDYHKVAQENIAYQGVQYGLASEWAPRVVLINLDIMGDIMPYPVPDTWTWDDVLQYALAVTRETPKGEQYGLILTHEPWRDWNIVRAWGGRFFDEDVTESRFDDPNTRDCFQWMWDARFVHQVTPPIGTLQAHGGPFQTFSAGTIGMWPTPSDQAKAMIEEVGDSFKLGIAPEPFGAEPVQPGGARFSFEGNMGWFIPSGSNWPDIAYELMRWRAADDDQALRTALSGFGGFPARKSSGKWNVMQIEPSLPGYGHAAWKLGSESSECFPSFPIADEWCRFWQRWWHGVWIGDEPFFKGDLEGMHNRTTVLLAARKPCVEPKTG